MHGKFFFRELQEILALAIVVLGEFHQYLVTLGTGLAAQLDEFQDRALGHADVLVLVGTRLLERGVEVVHQGVDLFVIHPVDLGSAADGVEFVDRAAHAVQAVLEHDFLGLGEFLHEFCDGHVRRDGGGGVGWHWDQEGKASRTRSTTESQSGQA